MSAFYKGKGKRVMRKKCNICCAKRRQGIDSRISRVIDQMTGRKKAYQARRKKIMAGAGGAAAALAIGLFCVFGLFGKNDEDGEFGYPV